MARYFDVHPDNPQPRAIAQIADILRTGGVVAYPTDTTYALGCRIGNPAGLERIREIRRLDSRHHFTVVCDGFSQVGHYMKVGNAAFRAIRAATPGPYTFILPATREVPRQLMHPKKLTIGVRMPGTPFVHALLADLGEPLMSTTLLLPDAEEPLTQGWDIKERLDHLVDAVVDTGDCGAELTTVVDLSGPEPEVLRRGSGDPTRFE